MIKSLIAAALAFIVGVVVTTQKKDQEILKLNKRITRLTSYEEFSKTFQEGWTAGYQQGQRAERNRTYLLAPFN
ncbi:MAG: hypothetical protein ACJ74Y_14250 [Bryobacteraceae bacterium]|jgi:flagellar biosynthesis/type III secretory pathway protein FliH